MSCSVASWADWSVTQFADRNGSRLFAGWRSALWQRTTAEAVLLKQKSAHATLPSCAAGHADLVGAGPPCPTRAPRVGDGVA